MPTATHKNEFAAIGLSAKLFETTQELGYEKLTPIQAQSLPVILKGLDIVGQSKTGSGKTASFSLPILEKIDLDTPRLQALIMCPTRELSSQVAREIRRLGRRLPGLQVLVVSGGQPKYPQRMALKKGVHIVVGTPGRILDHLQGRSLDLRQVSTVVLDEADRMLDMGFEEDMELILGSLPKKRQMLFFSATFSDSIRKMSEKYQREPERITIEEPIAAEINIQQSIYEVPEQEKHNALLMLMQHYPCESAIVFCNQKAVVKQLGVFLGRNKLSVGCLHGDLEQHERDRVMAKFRNSSVRILLATDVAARGIDIVDLDIVINFDMPLTADIYVHRIGRTGRAGKSGRAVTLMTPREKWKLPAFEQNAKAEITRCKLADIKPTHVKPSQVAIFARAQMQTLYISGGRKEKVRPGDILGALTGQAGRLKGSDIGKIEVHDHYSYVAVSSTVADLATKRLSEGKIKGRKFRVNLTR